jgi:hypothetical protein
MDDARVRPDLFHWNGRIDSTGLSDWLDRNRWLGQCPGDLLDFWKQTGGGEVFETETILGPLGHPEMGDDIAAVNREMRSNGMPDRFVVYHHGLVISAVDTGSGDYVELAPSGFDVLRRFATLEEWYRATLRAEYEERYGLP